MDFKTMAAVALAILSVASASSAQTDAPPAAPVVSNAPALEPTTANPVEEEAIFRGETIVVTPDPGFEDFGPWRKAIEAAIAKAPLKERSQLTAHDLEQILVLKTDMPKLKQALDDMDAVIAANPKASMLTDNEKLALMRAYLVTQSILMNVPDELTIACRQRNRPGQRNEELVCEFDYARAEDMMRHVGSAFKTSLHKPINPKRRFMDRAAR